MEKFTSSSTSSFLNDLITAGMYTPSFETSQFELEEMIKKRIGSCNRDSAAATSKKAHAFVAFNDKVEEIQFSKSQTPYCLVTINPKPEITYDQFQEKVDSVIAKVFDWSIHAYEIRSVPDQGLHCHIIAKIKDKYLTSNFARVVKSPFVPVICGTVKHIDIKYVSQKELSACKSYITKTKVAKSKKIANDATVAWRLANDIPLMITTGDIPTCLSPDPE